MGITGQHFNVMSLVGLVIMIGAVDNDAVIVVDLITGLRRDGIALREAIVRGMQQRSAADTHDNHNDGSGDHPTGVRIRVRVGTRAGADRATGGWACRLHAVYGGGDSGCMRRLINGQWE